jgi:hypothetical protein
MDDVAITLQELLENMNVPIGLQPWETLEWQHSKRILAKIISNCICITLNCKVYILDVHGGAPSEGLGGKDIDFIIDCKYKDIASSLEEIIENIVKGQLRELIGEDPYKYLGIPNIVEFHSVNEFLFKKYVELGPPYAIKLCDGL